MRAGPCLRRALLVVCWFSLFGSGGCQRKQSATDLFPISNEVVGWVKTGDTRNFEAGELWKYIDGEAERYLKSGVQRVLTADYKYQNKIDVVIDIYTMKSAEGATNIFDSEPKGDAKSVRLGDAGRLYSQSLIFSKGPYLVRIVAYQESMEFSQAIMELGRNIERRLTR